MRDWHGDGVRMVMASHLKKSCFRPKSNRSHVTLYF